MTPAPVPTEPFANKAVVSGIGTIVLVLLRWAVSGEFNLSDEGLVTLAGAITTVAVYAVSNFRRLIGIRENGHSLVELVVAVLLVLILALVLLRLV